MKFAFPHSQSLASMVCERIARRLGIGLVTAWLVACGGVGDLAGGVGSGGSGLAEGTITGFGSVYVDGERYDDSQARVTEEGPSGAREAALKIGQRVRLKTRDGNIADSIEVITELLGPIERVVPDGPAAQRLTVLGQQVRVQTSTTDGVAATWTDFGVEQACAPSCEFAVNQWVQVHGSWLLDDATDSHYLLASRIEVVGAQGKILLSGVVREIVGGVARLNAPSGNRVDLGASPSGVMSAVDQVLRVWAPPPAGAPGAVVQAERLMTTTLMPSLAASSTVLGGEVSRVNADGSEIEIQGTRIAVPPQFRGAISAQRFARVELEKGESGWQLKAPPQLPGGAERAEVQISEEIPAGRLAQIPLGNWSLKGTLLTRTVLSPACAQLANEPPATKVRVSVQAVRGPLPMRVLSVQCSRT